MPIPISRLLALLLAATAVTLVLSGCAMPGSGSSTSRGGADAASARTPAPTTSPPSRAPSPTQDLVVRARPGDCWHEPDPGAVARWLWWEGGAPVDCATEHTAITYAVAELPTDLRYPENGPSGVPVLEGPEATYLRSRCHPSGVMNDGIEDGSRITSALYLPTPEQWAQGERWVRCDLGVQALGPVSDHAREPLPATVPEVLAESFGAYRRCLDTPLATEDHAPLGALDRSEHVACEDAQWVFASSIEFDEVAWPGTPALVQATEAQCWEDLTAAASWRTGGLVTTPDEEAWERGRRTAECWLS